MGFKKVWYCDDCGMEFDNNATQTSDRYQTEINGFNMSVYANGRDQYCKGCWVRRVKLLFQGWLAQFQTN